MDATASRMRAAFAEVARGLMEWAPPPVPPWDILGGKWAESALTMNPAGTIIGDELRRMYRPRGKQETPEYVEPFDVQADWEERG